MNSFLQQMLKRSADELDGGKISRDIAKPKVERLPQHESSNWLKNRSTCSLNESDSTIKAKSPSRPITLKIGEYRKQRKSMPGLTTPKGTTDSEEVPSIEKIRREFEMGFMSPTKQDVQEISTRSGRFVKKLVAAFEEKYNKTFNDGKTEKKRFSRDYSVSSENSSFEDETMLADMMEENMEILSKTYVVESLESRLSRYLNSYIATSSLREEESPSESDESSIDLGKSSFTMDEELRSPKQNMSRKKKTTRPNSEKIFTAPIIEEESMESRGKVVRSDSSLKRERQPKIVGAYLKEPVEIEDTAIDWIPITGKKLPRKRSFKRLLSILTGKKSSLKSSKLYCSELNLQEETSRDLLQDSGYDEKSGSSSSLVSLVSVNDLISQQRTECASSLKDDRRVYNMTTFQKAAASVVEPENISDNDNDYPEDDFSSINDDASDTGSVSSKKILLDEVSRSDLRLSLGPAFPSAAGAKVVCSLGRRSTNKPAKNNWAFLDDVEPLAPPLPKHPFVSLKQKSVNEAAEDNAQERPTNKSDDQSDLSFSDFDKVELRRDRQTWKFPTEDCHYDTPRRYLSKSEPVLASLHKPRNVGKLPIDIVYDVPQLKVPKRPRSSIYDDALSLKRRNDHFTSHQPPLAHEFYGFPTTSTEPHYATIKPRNTRINADRQFLRSLGGLDGIDPTCIDYYYDRASNGIVV